MLITKESEVVLASKSITLFENLGYEIPKYWDKKHKKMSVCRGTKIKVKTKDLPKGSHVRVDVKCDYCGSIKNVSYKDYNKDHDEKLGDCCVRCRHIKYKETMSNLYGVCNSMFVPEILEKIKETNRQKYGHDWHMQREGYQERYKSVMMERHGHEHALQVPQFAKQARETMAKRGHLCISKPQKLLSEILLDMYGNCELEKPCGGCSLDCVVSVGDIKIDVEYDGWFWHQDSHRDVRRDNWVKKNGYSVFRIKANHHDDMPTREQIDEQVQKLLHGWHYVEIQM